MTGDDVCKWDVDVVDSSEGLTISAYSCIIMIVLQAHFKITLPNKMLRSGGKTAVAKTDISTIINDRQISKR